MVGALSFSWGLCFFLQATWKCFVAHADDCNKWTVLRQQKDRPGAPRARGMLSAWVWAPGSRRCCSQSPTRPWAPSRTRDQRQLWTSESRREGAAVLQPVTRTLRAHAARLNHVCYGIWEFDALLKKFSFLDYWLKQLSCNSVIYGPPASLTTCLAALKYWQFGFVGVKSLHY